MISKKYKNIRFILLTLKIVCLIFFNQADLFAQDYLFKRLKTEDGLSQTTIFASLQDKEGFMWFGTRNGLNRYDGYEFVVFNNDPMDPNSISDEGISSLFEDSEGILWVGTINGNLNKYNSQSENFVYKNLSLLLGSLPDQPDEYYEYPLFLSRIQKNSITCIKEDLAGTLWIGTWGKGIINVDKNFKLLNHFHFDPKKPEGLKTNRIMDLHFDSDGKLWVATFGGGLTRILTFQKNKRFSYQVESLSKGPGKYKLPDDKLLKIFEDSKSNIWIGSYFSGLILISSDELYKPLGQMKIKCHQCPITKNKLSQNTILTLAEDNQNNLWIGTFGGGLIRFNFIKNETKHFFNDPLNENSLGDNDVLSLCVDRSGIIWAGSHLGAGITKIQYNSARFNQIKPNPLVKNSLNDDVVWSIYKDEENNLWLGTYKGGINILNLSKNSFSSIQKSDKQNSLSSNHIRVIKEDNYRNLWIGTYNGGLNIINKNNLSIKTFLNDPGNKNSISAHQIQDIFIESDSVFYIATFGGGLNKVVCRGNPFTSQLKFTSYRFNNNDDSSISDNRVYKIFRSKDGYYWIGTHGGGINQFNPLTGKFKRYPVQSESKNTFNIQNCMTIEEDYSGLLWIGSYGGSLTSFDRKNGTFKRYSYEEGLSSGAVYGILEDNNKNLWLSTDNGIFRFNLLSKVFTRYDIQDGLQNLEFSGGAYFKDKEGIFYFGGISGVNYFDPLNIKSNYYSPPVVVTSVKIFNEPYKGNKKEITLDYKENFISIEFSSLDYSDPQDNQYSYMLEGLQNEWIISNSSSRVANYTNLTPGTYNFKVKATNSNGVWSDNYASIKIIVKGPFWKTWWFITLTAFMLAAFLYYLSTMRIKNLLAIEKLKSKLAADLHDNIGSGLTEISILSEVASRSIKGSGNNGNELSKISDISRQLVDNMSDIVWVVNPNRDSLHDLVLRLKDSYSDLLSSLGVSFKSKNLEKLENIKLPMEVKQNLYLIFKEAINNAIKHSGCSHITLEANLRNNIIEIALYDDGKGFDETKITYGNGLKNLVNRAKQIGGKIKIKSVVNSGTSIRFLGKAGANKLLNFITKK